MALRPENLLCACVGATLGRLSASLAAVGPAAMIAMLLPLAQHIGTAPALILLAGVVYGAQFAVSTPSIVGASSSSSGSFVAVDAQQLARQGRAGAALAIAAIVSFLAAGFATLLIAIVVPWLAALATGFGPHEVFALTLAGLVGAVVLAPGRLVKSLAMLVLGLLVADLFGSTGLGDVVASLRQGCGERRRHRRRRGRHARLRRHRRPAG